MKKTLIILALTMGISAFAQEEKQVYVKGNALFLPVLVMNGAVEYQLSEKFTAQGDFFISPWKSFAGKYAQMYMAGVEGRYYFRKAFSGFYLGANISASAFSIQKWNYWGSGAFFYPHSDIESPYQKSDYYQKGFSFIVGITGGYQFELSDRWKMDVYAGIGNSQGFYKGRIKSTGERVDNFNGVEIYDHRKWNRSGEIIPYRGGIMLSYKLK